MMKHYPGLPLQSGASESIWLHSVKGNPLLDYTSGDLPDRADVVIIGSGVSTPASIPIGTADRADR